MAEIDYSTEEWRDIPDLIGSYQVSSLGRVRSMERRVAHPICKLKTVRARILKPGTHTGGYPIYNIGGRMRGAHRLVCEAFYGPPPAGYEAAHRNGVPSDNKVENLRWASVRENRIDQIAHGTSAAGERHGNSRLTWDVVRQIRASHQSGVSKRALAREHGVASWTIQRIISGEGWREP